MSGENVWLTNDKGVKLVDLTDDRLPEALKLMRESYYTDEPVARGTRLQVTNPLINRIGIFIYREGFALTLTSLFLILKLHVRSMGRCI
jgi:hypothetical protein